MRHPEAVRREWLALFKGCNAVPGQLGCSLRARREAVIRFVAPFGKGWAIACKARRATNRFTPRCIHQSLVVRPLLGRFEFYRAELEFRDLAERIERLVGQQVGRRLVVAERNKDLTLL